MTETKEDPTPKAPQPIKNLTGASIAGGMAFCLYLLTTSIGNKLAASPVTAGGMAARISVVVRTALLAVGTGATMIFAVVALGLILLTIQQALTKQPIAEEPDQQA